MTRIPSKVDPIIVSVKLITSFQERRTSVMSELKSSSSEDENKFLFYSNKMPNWSLLELFGQYNCNDCFLSLCVNVNDSTSLKIVSTLYPLYSPS